MKIYANFSDAAKLLDRETSELRMRRIRILFQKTKFKPAVFIIPALLGICATLFETLHVALLIPLMNAIIKTDMSILREIEVLNNFLDKFVPINLTNTHLFGIMISLIFLSALLKQIFRYVSTLGGAKIVIEFCAKLRSVIFESYMSFGKKFFDENSLGYLQQVLMDFTQQMSNSVRNIQVILTDAFILIAYFIIMFYISWQLTLLSCLLFPLLHYGVRWIILKIEKTSKDYAETKKQLSKKMVNALSCIPLVKANNVEKEEVAQFTQTSSIVGMFEFSIRKKMNFMRPVQETLMLIAMLVLVSVMAVMIVKGNGDTSVAEYLMFFYVLRRAASCMGVFNDIKANIASMQGPLDDLCKILDDRDKPFIKDGHLEFKGLQNQINIENLKFGYVEDTPVIQGIDLTIKKNSMLAIVGHSGAGKSTIAHLLMRLYDPSSGRICMDDTDIRELTLKSLRSKSALVSQETLLLNDTIKANLTYGLAKGEVSEKRIYDALKQAHLYEFVMSRPEKLEMLIGDRGVKLSGGEKQRLSIARALLKEAEILILDEATSSLDSQSEKLIQMSLDQIKQGRTTIAIAHRLSTIKNADEIIVLEKGKIVERGNLESLIKKEGVFYSFWNEQKFD